MSEAKLDMIEVQGQAAVRVQSPDGAQATVLLHGAQVISWIPAGVRSSCTCHPKR